MRPDRPGVALMLVLWLVVVLSATAAGVVALSRSEANAVLAYRSRTVAGAAAASGVEATVAALRRAYGSAESPGDRMGVLASVQERLERQGRRALGDGRFQVVVRDLTGRVPINSADYPTLLRLFSLTAGPERAPSLAAELLDWVDADDIPRPSGGEAAQYEEAGSPYRPLNRPFQRIEELARLPGMDAELAAALEPDVTVHPVRIVNLNTASALALAAVTGMEMSAAERLVAMRGGRPFRSMDEVRSAAGLGDGFIPLSLGPSLLEVVSRGWLEGRPYTREIRVVVEVRDLAGPNGPSIVRVGWEERDL